MKRDFVCGTPAIHPIDLAAIVMHHALKPISQPPNILIMDDTETSKSLANRLLETRLALPTPLLLLDERDIYRQVFFPFAENDKANNKRAVEFSAQLIINSVSDNFWKNQIKNRADLLQEALVRNKSRDIFKKPEKLLGLIIKLIIERIIQQEVKISTRTRAMPVNKYRALIQQAIIAIATEAKTSNQVSFAFTKGGYIQVTDQFGNLWQLSKGAVNDDVVYFYNDAGKVIIKVDLNSNRVLFENNNEPAVSAGLSLRLRGPSELAFISFLGEIPHIPWYCDVSEGNAGSFLGNEIISPISVSDMKRSSLWSGGEGKRLTPSGYTLLDYEHPAVLSFIEGTCHLKDTSFESYEDWRHLCNNYPATKQKALKHQGGISQYCELRLSDLRQNLIEGGTEAMTNISSDSALSVASYGKQLLSWVSILRFMKATAIGQSNLYWSAKQLAILNDLAILKNNQFCADEATSRCIELINLSRKWRDKIAQPVSLVQKVYELDFLDVLHLINSHQEKDVIEYTLTQQNGLPPGKLARIILDETELYYKCVLALCASALKANIWTCWLLLGEMDYIEVCKKILFNRETKIFALSIHISENENPSPA